MSESAASSTDASGVARTALGAVAGRAAEPSGGGATTGASEAFPAALATRVSRRCNHSWYSCSPSLPEPSSSAARDGLEEGRAGRTWLSAVRSSAARAVRGRSAMSGIEAECFDGRVASTGSAAALSARAGLGAAAALMTLEGRGAMDDLRCSGMAPGSKRRLSSRHGSGSVGGGGCGAGACLPRSGTAAGGVGCGSGLVREGARSCFLWPLGCGAVSGRIGVILVPEASSARLFMEAEARGLTVSG